MRSHFFAVLLLFFSVLSSSYALDTPDTELNLEGEFSEICQKHGYCTEEEQVAMLKDLCIKDDDITIKVDCTSEEEILDQVDSELDSTEEECDIEQRTELAEQRKENLPSRLVEELADCDEIKEEKDDNQEAELAQNSDDNPEEDTSMENLEEPEEESPTKISLIADHIDTFEEFCDAHSADACFQEVLGQTPPPTQVAQDTGSDNGSGSEGSGGSSGSGASESGSTGSSGHPSNDHNDSQDPFSNLSDSPFFGGLPHHAGFFPPPGHLPPQHSQPYQSQLSKTDPSGIGAHGGSCRTGVTAVEAITQETPSLQEAIRVSPDPLDNKTAQIVIKDRDAKNKGSSIGNFLNAVNHGVPLYPDAIIRPLEIHNLKGDIIAIDDTKFPDGKNHIVFHSTGCPGLHIRGAMNSSLTGSNDVLPYHFAIDRLGKIYLGNNGRGAHIKTPSSSQRRGNHPEIMNSTAFGIVLLDTDNSKDGSNKYVKNAPYTVGASKEQLISSQQLVQYLDKRFRIKTVIGHGEDQKDRERGEGLDATIIARAIIKPANFAALQSFQPAPTNLIFDVNPYQNLSDPTLDLYKEQQLSFIFGKHNEVY